jgi:antitoxin component of MazEF toxin-antitoxin module
MSTTVRTQIRGFGNNTGIEVPAENIAELGAGKQPPVQVTVAGYTYPSTVAVRGGTFLISLSKAHREASGLSAGDSVEVTLVLEDGPRTVHVPPALAEALEAAGLNQAFAELSYSKRKELCRQVADAKAEETRTRRIAKVVDALS